MHKKYFKNENTMIGNATKLLLIIFLILFASSCGIEKEQNRLPDISEDAPLSEFILGKWKYEGKYYYEGYGYSDIYWEYTFVDNKVIKIWTGNDGGTCTYKFIEAEVISVDCSPRMLELMTWSVKRDSEYLLI